MSCKEILPQISIDGISVRQIEFDGTSDATLVAGAFSPQDDERFELTISHTNLIEVDNFLDSFSLRDVLDATVGAPNLYNVKVLVTNDPDRYELIQEMVKVAQEVGFYLYNGTQTPTAQEVVDFIDKTPADAPKAAKDAAEAVNKCIFKQAGANNSTETNEDGVSETEVQAKLVEAAVSTGVQTVDLTKLAAIGPLGKTEEEKEEEREQVKAAVSTGVQTADLTKLASMKPLSTPPTTVRSKPQPETREPVLKKRGKKRPFARPTGRPTDGPAQPANPPTTVLQKILAPLKNNAFKAEAVKLVSLADRILKALNDNESDDLSPTTDGIFSFTVPLQVSGDQIEISGDPPQPKIINSQKTQVVFSDTQLKNLYAVIIPNIEFRENNELIFTVRQYASIPLVEDFEPQEFGEEQVVDVSLLEQKPQFALDNFALAARLDSVKKAFGEKGYYSYLQNTGNQKVVSDPLVSLDYNNVVNGTFFLSKKNLSKNLTAYQVFLDNPDLYNDVLFTVKMSKVFSDGVVETMEDPTTLTGFTFNRGIAIGYKFTDFYDPREYEYKVTVTAKNPLESLFKYALPKLQKNITALSEIISSLDIDRTSVIVFNPVSGYFTDDFINSNLYKVDNQNYQTLRKQLFDLYNFLLPQFEINVMDRKLVSFDQFQELQEQYDEAYGTLSKIAKSEGIDVSEQGSRSSAKGQKKDFKPYKTFDFTFDKGYIHKDSRVFYDFVNQSKPFGTAFFVNPNTLTARVNLEGITLDSYGVTDESNAYADDERLSLAPVSITIDDTTINLVTQDENFEQLYTDALLAAELEVKTPQNFYTTQSDLVGNLLNADGVTIGSPASAELVEIPSQDNFIPGSIDSSRTFKRGKKLTKGLQNLVKFAKDSLEVAVQQLGQQATKSLYLDQATYGYNLVLAAILGKRLGKIDDKHGKVAQLLGDVEYKLRPASYITRLMNAYQLEYVSTFTDDMEPVYTPLTKQFFVNLPPSTNVMARVVLKAGIPIESDFDIFNEHFIISNSVAAQAVAVPFSFLDTEVPTLITAEDAQTILGFQGLGLLKRPTKDRSSRRLEKTTRPKARAVINQRPQAEPATTTRPQAEAATSTRPQAEAVASVRPTAAPVTQTRAPAPPVSAPQPAVAPPPPRTTVVAAPARTTPVTSGRRGGGY